MFSINPLVVFTSFQQPCNTKKAREVLSLIHSSIKDKELQVSQSQEIILCTHFVVNTTVGLERYHEAYPIPNTIGLQRYHYPIPIPITSMTSSEQHISVTNLFPQHWNGIVIRVHRKM